MSSKLKVKFYLKSTNKIKVKTLSDFYEDTNNMYGSNNTKRICDIAEKSYENYKVNLLALCDIKSIGIIPDMGDDLIKEIENSENFVKWLDDKIENTD